MSTGVRRGARTSAAPDRIGAVTSRRFLTLADVAEVLNTIQKCENILSSSLHGLIIGMSYGIPSQRFVFSDRIYGDGIKYQDFFQSVNIDKHSPISISESPLNFSGILKHMSKHSKATLIQSDLINLQDNLLSVCPFRSA